jgi:putative polyketide hydroxylase
MSVYRVGSQGDLLDPGRNWIRKAGVAEDGAILLRPDGFVAWRACNLAQRPERLLKSILHRVLGQSAAIAVEEFS